MILSTTDTIEGRKVLQYLNVVYVDTIFSFSMDGIWANPRYTGGNRSELQSELEAATAETLDLIQKRADEIGANAVLGYKINFSSAGDRSMVISAYGTAVILE